jgi:hypothetical protein
MPASGDDRRKRKEAGEKSGASGKVQAKALSLPQTTTSKP